MTIKPKLLIIRQLALGDVILTTPIIKQLYLDHSGDCEIDVLTMKPEAFTNSPYIKDTISPEEYLKNKKHYHKIINLDLAYENYPNLHIIEAYAKYSHGSIEKIKSKQVEIYENSNDVSLITEIITNKIHDEYVVIHMRQDTWPSRNLPEETWKNIIDKLINETTLKIVQVGSPHEISFDHNPRLINLLGKLTIQQLKVLIEKSLVYVGVDSGTLHVASSTTTPIVSIFTSAHHHFRQPLGRHENNIFIPITPKLDCYGCQSRMKPPITGVICPEGDPYSPPCINAISVEMIIKAVHGILN